MVFASYSGIVRRPHRKHHTFCSWKHDNSVTGFKATVHVIMLYVVQQDVIRQMIYGMERRIHPVSPCTGPTNPGITQDTGAKCGLEFLPICSNKVNADSHRRRRAARRERLGSA